MTRGKPDGGLRAILHDRLREGFMWQALESALTGGGIPDSVYVSHGTSGVVESKWTEGWAVTLRPEQVGWLLQWTRNGGIGFVAVRRLCSQGVKRPAADELWLCRAEFARELKQHGLRGCPPEAVLGTWYGGPAKWDWAEVASHLRR